MAHELDLPRTLQAPSRARRALDGWYGDSLEEGELSDAVIVASELVTNAVIHGVGRIRMATHLDADRLRIEVMDEGSGFEYTLRDVPPEQGHGRGLVVVDAFSSRWGIDQGSTHVWAEIERSGLTPSEPKRSPDEVMTQNESPRAEGNAAARKLPADGLPSAAAPEARAARAVHNATRAADLAALSAAETHRRSAQAHESAVGIHEQLMVLAGARGDRVAARRHHEAAENERQAAELARHSAREASRRANNPGGCQDR